MESIRREYQTIIEKNLEANRKAAWETRDWLLHSSVAYHGRCVRTLQIPKVFTHREIARFREIVSVTYAIFQKVIREYLKNPEYRKLFPFSPELEELILVPSLYDSLLPIARFDIFYNEEDGSFKFCEINTDGTSAMNEDYVLNQAIELNPAHQMMRQRHRFSTFELYDSWVQTFLSIYRTYQNRVEHPHVAIVDFLENASITEFEEFQRRFEKAGISCEIAEITQLSYERRKLLSPSGRPIDAVYRRAVTTDICARADEIQPFLQAVKNQDVCLIGAFKTQIIHNKWLFKMLREEPTLSLLTPAERIFVHDHIPFTELLDSRTADCEKLIREKDRWLIKPLDSYASRGVWAGCDCTEQEWARHIKESMDRNYIYQEYCQPYQTGNICFIEEPAEFKDYANMSGLFVYDGQLAGIYSRLSDGGIISSQYNEKAVPTLVLEQ